MSYLILKTEVTPDNTNKHISLLETTGEISVVNPGGYGAGQEPANTRRIADIIGGYMAVLTRCGTFTYEGATTPVAVGLLYSTTLDGTEAQDLADGTAVTYDLNTLIGADYVDGVYKVLYYNQFTGADVVNQTTPASDIVNVPDYTEFLGAKYIKIFVDADEFIYEILDVKTNNTIKINKAITLESDYNYEVMYEVVTYFANTYDINQCLHGRIAKYACQECGCQEKAKASLLDAVMRYEGIQPNMDKKDYVCAANVIDSLTIYCSKDCDC